MAHRRRCPVCRSKQWHKEPSSGLIACSEGHLLQNYRNEASEADEMGPHTMLKRTLKSGRKKKGNQSKADPKLYHGPRGRYHYFQCLQLLLRHQIAALVNLWDLPPEFEIICRDIWALHLNLLPIPPPPEPYFYMQETKDDQDAKIPDHEGEDQEELQDRTPSSSDTEDDLDLLTSSSNSSSLVDNTEAASPPKAKRKARGKRGDFALEKPASCVAVLILSFWTMRIPIFLKDLVRIIETYELPYLEHIRFLPAKMTKHLTKHNKQSLSPYHAPSVTMLHALSSGLAKRMYASYGVCTPEANVAPLLWRSVRELGGTPTLYILTKRLGRALNLPLTLHHTLAPSLERREEGDPGSHKYDNVAPEVALTAAAVVVLMMIYGDKRVARITERVEKKEMDDKRVEEMDEREMDEYLRLCEKGLVDDRQGKT